MVIEFDKMKLAKRIKELRLASGNTQESISEKIDMESSNYNKFETGKTMPTVPTLIKIANGLNVTPNQIFDFKYLDDENTLDKINLEIYKRLEYKQKLYVYKMLNGLLELG